MTGINGTTTVIQQATVAAANKAQAAANLTTGGMVFTSFLF
jgi:hypothetical protein